MKRLLKLTMMVIALTALFSCTKDEGTVTFANTSGDPYSVYIDGGAKSPLAGNTSANYSVSSGTHSYEVVQQSGFAVTPKDEKGSFSVAKGGSTNVTFP